MPRKARLRDANTYEAKLLDPVNLRVLDELVSDGRIAMAELGQRLERAGVIAGYRAELDPRALGFLVSAVVRIRPAPGQLQRIPEVARGTPEVAECHRI